MLFVLLTMAFALGQGGVREHAAAESGGSISGVVYFDFNGNGVRDVDEPAVVGLVVELRQSPYREATRTVKTGADGSYRFDDLLPGVGYAVRLETDAKTSCATSPGYGLSGSAVWPEEDIPILEPGDGVVTGKLISDLNGNGVLDTGGPPLEGWLLHLAGACDVLTATDAAGAFHASGLQPGSYSLYLIPPAPKSGEAELTWELSFPAPPMLPGLSDLPPGVPEMLRYWVEVDVTSAPEVSDLVVGAHILQGNASIVIRTFEDANLNGKRDEGERLLDCCTPTFLHVERTGTFWVQTAEPRTGVGEYQVSGVPAGNYIAALALWTDNPTGELGPGGRPMSSLVLAEGQRAEVEFGFGPKAPESPLPPATTTPTPDNRHIVLPKSGAGPSGSFTRALALGLLSSAVLIAAGVSTTLARRGRKDLSGRGLS